MNRLSGLTLGLFLVAGTAQAAPIPVNCPNSVSITDREFTVTTDPSASTCFMFGNVANQLNANASDLMFLAGWTIIDKDQNPDAVFTNDSWFSVTGLGATSGSFTVSPTAWFTFARIAVGFVVGGGQIDPKWAVFELPNGETAGTWSDAPPQGGGLSHANLYGMGTPTNPPAVPEPASLVLLGTGLLGTVRAVRRRRNQAT